MSSIYGRYWIKAREKYDINEYHTNYINLINRTISKNSKILDVGVGTGIPFADRLQKNGYCLHGIDISEELINKCKENNSFILCKQGDSEKIDYPESYFDCTYCFASTWYFPDLYKSIDEMIRVTKKNGLLFFDIQNINNYEVRKNYEKRIKEKTGINIVINYLKNIVKIILGSGFVDWTNIIYDVPSDPKKLLDHLKSQEIQNLKIYYLNNNLKEIKINKELSINSGCLLFSIKV